MSPKSKPPTKRGPNEASEHLGLVFGPGFGGAARARVGRPSEPAPQRSPAVRAGRGRTVARGGRAPKAALRAAKQQMPIIEPHPKWRLSIWPQLLPNCGPRTHTRAHTHTLCVGALFVGRLWWWRRRRRRRRKGEEEEITPTLLSGAFACHL